MSASVVEPLPDALRESAREALDAAVHDDGPLRALYARLSSLVGKRVIAGPLGRVARDVSIRSELLIAASERMLPSKLEALIDDLLRHGDAREQCGVLRALAFLPEPSRFVPHARRASRTNVVPVFEALACENPFPALYLPEDAFNQLVMKALFVGLPLARVVGLRCRVGAELRRMAADFAAERRAAGRPVPDDLALLEEPSP